MKNYWQKKRLLLVFGRCFLGLVDGTKHFVDTLANLYEGVPDNAREKLLGSAAGAE